MRRRSFVLAIMLLLVCCHTTHSSAAPSTAEFMDRLIVCAGGAGLKIDGQIMGSVRSVYEGDRTEGKIELKTEAAFFARLPEQDRLKAFDLYHKCIRDIVSGAALITHEILSFRFKLNAPGELLYELNKAGVDYDRLLQAGDFFPSLLSDVAIDYKLMLDKCDWRGLAAFNASNRFYYQRGHLGHMFPDIISVSKKLQGQHFAGGTYFFRGDDWNADKSSKSTSNSPPALKSIDDLTGTCLYVIIGLPFTFNFQYVKNPTVRRQLELYSAATFRSIELTHFTIRLSDKAHIVMYVNKRRAVEISSSGAIWEFEMPKTVDEFQMRN